MKRYYKPVCEKIITDNDYLLNVTSTIISTGDSGGYNPIEDDNPPVDNSGDGINSDGFAKGCNNIWDN